MPRWGNVFGETFEEIDENLEAGIFQIDRLGENTLNCYVER